MTTSKLFFKVHVISFIKMGSIIQEFRGGPGVVSIIQITQRLPSSDVHAASPIKMGSNDGETRLNITV